MTIRIVMPQLGESVSEGVVGRWLKREGDRVERDEPLVEVITDKVNAEIPAVAAGVLKRISVAEGETVAVGTEIAVLDDGAAEAPATEVGLAAGASLPPAAPPSSASSGTEEVASHETRGSPLVRRLAREHGLDLAEIQGSGLHGRVTKEDVLAFVSRRGGKPADERQSAGPPFTPSSAGTPGSETKISPLRRMIAEHMVRSKTTVPHATTFVEVDMSALVRRRAAVKAEFASREGVDLTYVPFVILAAVQALQRFPSLNAEWADDRIVQHQQINIGLAVSTEQGLVVPVIRDAGQFSVAGLARKISELGERARTGKLTLDDVRGGTFTVNNPGVFGTILSVPIINAPQAGILTMDAVVKRPVVVDEDAIAVRAIMNLGLAFDHRLNDGLAAARFLASVREVLENQAAGLV
ncbi:MAG: 2-oxo acid dehydrogenase subunit E2 [Chloroflexi bacterium]|nr:2-oxo acid dehydrogenase subunit E2 [Chloroflexota bacterium]